MKRVLCCPFPCIASPTLSIPNIVWFLVYKIAYSTTYLFKTKANMAGWAGVQALVELLSNRHRVPHLTLTAGKNKHCELETKSVSCLILSRDLSCQAIMAHVLKSSVHFALLCMDSMHP